MMYMLTKSKFGYFFFFSFWSFNVVFQILIFSVTESLKSLRRVKRNLNFITLRIKRKLLFLSIKKAFFFLIKIIVKTLLFPALFCIIRKWNFTLKMKANDFFPHFVNFRALSKIEYAFLCMSKIEWHKFWSFFSFFSVFFWKIVVFVIYML